MEYIGSNMNIIDWRIDYRCNAECSYCFASKHLPLMTQTEESIILNKISHSNVNVVNITGGEPMLDTLRCIRIIRSLHENGKSVYLSTNGYAFDSWKQDINRLALLGLPLDGYDIKSNMIDGRDQNSFIRVLEILDSPEAFRTNIKIGTVVTRNSIDRMRLIKISEFLDKYPVQVWRIYEMIPEDRGAVNQKALALNKLERCMLLEIVRELCEIEHPYRIELVTREMLSSAYFIIQPNGVVMTPIDYGEVVNEIELGSLITHSINELKEKWLKKIKVKNPSHYMKERYCDVKGVYE